MNDSRPDVHTWALNGADWVATRSKDPGRKVGAVILRQDNTLVSVGYNGFPKKVKDDPTMLADKATKLRRTVHAELNAILTAREPLHGCTIFVSPLYPCSQCAAAIIQSGITTVVARIGSSGGDSWRDSFKEAERLFNEADVDVILYKSDSYEQSYQCCNHQIQHEITDNFSRRGLFKSFFGLIQ